MSIFVDLRDRRNGMERKKLKRLREDGDESYENANKLEKERNKLLKELTPSYQNEKKKFRVPLSFSKMLEH